MKFRRGGKLKCSDVLYYKGKKLEFVNCYEYLGVTLQQSWTFSKHLRKKKAKLLAKMVAMKGLDKLSISGANRLFEVMLKPIITFAIKIFWEKLTPAQLLILDQCKLMFYKRVLGLHYNVRNRKVMYMMGDSGLLTENLVANGLPSTSAFTSYMESWELKLTEFSDDFNEEFFMTPVFTQTEWKNSGFQKRHLVTRASVHGFHLKICTKADCMFPEEGCVCWHCFGDATSLSHCFRCEAIPSLSFLDSI